MGRNKGERVLARQITQLSLSGYGPGLVKSSLDFDQNHHGFSVAYLDDGVLKRRGLHPAASYELEVHRLAIRVGLCNP